MKILSLKLKEEIFETVENLTHQIHVSRNAYINDAVAFYNQLVRRKLLKKQLSQESKEVSKHSLEVLREFEKMEDELPG